MAKKIFLIHGENDYLIYKDLKDLKNKFQKENIEFYEYQGSKSLSFNQIYESIASSSLFGNSSNVIINQIGERNSIFPFIENLINFLPKLENCDSEIHIFHRGKVAKNTKLYKAIDKFGEIKECLNPKPDEILNVINKSLSMDKDAAFLLMEYTNSNLFALKNEIKKLTNLQLNSEYKIQTQDIEKYCVKIFSSNEVWGISKSFGDFILTNNEKSKLKLLEEFENNIINQIEPMQILYSLYSFTISFIKMKKLVKKGKGFRECLSIGYYFVKDFFAKNNLIEEEKLIKINSKLLDYEFQVKTGQIDGINGLRQLILSF